MPFEITPETLEDIGIGAAMLMALLSLVYLWLQDLKSRAAHDKAESLADARDDEMHNKYIDTIRLMTTEFNATMSKHAEIADKQAAAWAANADGVDKRNRIQHEGFQQLIEGFKQTRNQVDVHAANLVRVINDVYQTTHVEIQRVGDIVKVTNEALDILPEIKNQLTQLKTDLKNTSAQSRDAIIDRINVLIERVDCIPPQPASETPDSAPGESTESNEKFTQESQ